MCAMREKVLHQGSFAFVLQRYLTLSYLFGPLHQAECSCDSALLGERRERKYHVLQYRNIYPTFESASFLLIDLPPITI